MPSQAWPHLLRMLTKTIMGWTLRTSVTVLYLARPLCIGCGEFTLFIPSRRGDATAVFGTSNAAHVLLHLWDYGGRTVETIHLHWRSQRLQLDHKCWRKQRVTPQVCCTRQDILLLLYNTRRDSYIDLQLLLVCWGTLFVNHVELCWSCTRQKLQCRKNVPWSCMKSCPYCTVPDNAGWKKWSEDWRKVVSQPKRENWSCKYWDKACEQGRYLLLLGWMSCVSG